MSNLKELNLKMAAIIRDLGERLLPFLHHKCSLLLQFICDSLINLACAPVMSRFDSSEKYMRIEPRHDIDIVTEESFIFLPSRCVGEGIDEPWNFVFTTFSCSCPEKLLQETSICGLTKN